jgi:hypothetical protein
MPAAVEAKTRVLFPCSKGIPFNEAFQKAKAEGLIITSNARADVLLQKDGWRSVQNAWPIYTGTMTAYREPGNKIGSAVEYQDPETEEKWIFEVPLGFREDKNVILYVEHPDYDIEIDKRRFVVHANEGKLRIQSFPSKNGWYFAGQRSCIPEDMPIEEGKADARFLQRALLGVGPVVRGHFFFDSSWRGISLDHRPSSTTFGVLVEDTIKEELNRAKKAAAYAAHELQKLSEIAKPKSIEKLTELIEILTDQ